MAPMPWAGGRNAPRSTQLAAALSQARRRHCAVAIAKLDCLGRDVHFIPALMA
jgi:hypothetical protein